MSKGNQENVGGSFGSKLSNNIDNLGSQLRTNIDEIGTKISSKASSVTDNISVFKSADEPKEEIKNATGIHRYLEMANWPAIGSIILPNIGGFANGIYFAGQTCSSHGNSWYDTLNKPNWVAPKCAFGPTWTVMYSSMGLASYLVFKECDGFTDEAVLPLTLYGGQLLLNWAWTPIFFGLKDLKLAFIEISVLSGAAVATTAAFFKVDKKAGLLMLPYLAWLGYATALSHYIWKNNPSPKEVKDDKQN